MAGLQFLADLMHKYRVMPTPAYSQQENNTSIFASGRLAMNLDIPAALVDYRKLTSIHWDVVPLPKKVKAVTSGGGVAWSMISHAKVPERAWELLTWVAGPHVQMMECAANTTAPPRKSIAQSSCFDDPKLPPKHMEVFLKAPDFVHIDPIVLNWPAIDTLIEKQLSYLWDGSKQAQEVLPSLAAQVTHMLQQPS